MKVLLWFSPSASLATRVPIISVSSKPEPVVPLLITVGLSTESIEIAEVFDKEYWDPEQGALVWRFCLTLGLQ